MNTPAKLILGAVATGCIAVGVAAQIGTVQLPRDHSNRGTVSAQQPTAPSTSKPSPSPQPTPKTTTVAAPATSGDGEDDGGD